MAFQNRTNIYHVELSFADKSGDGERDNGACGQGEVSVDDCPVLSLANRRSTVEARPKQPQKDSTCINQSVNQSTNQSILFFNVA